MPQKTDPGGNRGRENAYLRERDGDSTPVLTGRDRLYEEAHRLAYLARSIRVRSLKNHRQYRTTVRDLFDRLESVLDVGA